MIASVIGVRRTRRYPSRPTQRGCRLRAGIRALRGWPDFATKGADMHRYVIAALVGTLAFAGHAMAADPQYTTIKMEIDVAKPAAAVSGRVGRHCDITKWLGNNECVVK